MMSGSMHRWLRRRIWIGSDLRLISQSFLVILRVEMCGGVSVNLVKGCRMREIVFYRELKILINGVRSYGIQHCCDKNIDNLISDSGKRNNFTIQVHKGFFLAQKSAIFLLQKILKEQKRLKADLKQARRDRDKDKVNVIGDLIKVAKYQEMVVRKSMDSIAWQLFGYDLTVMRRLYYGQELIDITDSNLDSELCYIDEFVEENPDGFVLISDLTSFIQVGDVVTFAPQKGIKIGELKEGKTNLEMFQLIDNAVKANCPRYLKSVLEQMDEKKKEQFHRDIKQIDRNVKTIQTLNEGKGIDLLTGLPVTIDKDEIQLSTFEDTVNELLEKCSKKGYAITVIEECLLIGVYETDKFPSVAFDAWAKGLGIKMPIIDLRHSMFDPLGYPIFLQPFKDDNILDIIKGKKVVKMTIDIETWMKTFENDGIKWRWLSKKETARINSNLKGKYGIFSLEGKGIENENENGVVQYIGEGVFSRVFTGLNTLSSIKKLLITSLEKSESFM